jgi:hypothetical protein
MQHLQKRANDKFIVGFLLSIAATLFGLALLYVAKFMNNNVSFAQYLEMLKTEPTFRSPILTLALLANIPLLYYIQQRRLYKSFAGLAVVIIGLGVLIVLNKMHLI